MNILELVNYVYLLKGNREFLKQCIHLYRLSATREIGRLLKAEWRKCNANPLPLIYLGLQSLSPVCQLCQW